MENQFQLHLSKLLALSLILKCISELTETFFFPTLNSVKKETYACVFFSKMHLIHAFCFKYFAGV